MQIAWYASTRPTLSAAGNTLRYEFTPIPDADGIQGPALIVTPNQVNPNQLTLTTSQPLDGVERTYRYAVSCTEYDSNGNAVAVYPYGTQLTLITYVIRPTISGFQSFCVVLPEACHSNLT